MRNVQYYDPHIDFIGHYLKRDRHKYVEWGWKKNDMNLYLNTFSFIVDIRPGSEYPLMNEVSIFIIIIIIVINIYSVPFINTVSRSSPYKLKKINKRITTFKITHKIYMINIRVP